MNVEETKNLRLNYIANVLDGGFFGFGIGFASYSTVIPLFVATLTDSAILIGLISAVHIMGWQIPQLLMAKSVSGLTRYKPMVMWMTIHERIPFLGLALIAMFYQQLGTMPTIILTFLMLTWQGFGAGFTANAWQNMIGKVIPSTHLATFFGSAVITRESFGQRRGNCRRPDFGALRVSRQLCPVLWFMLLYANSIDHCSGVYP
jgi:hypothetical protein